jgi:hypothetical protein
MRGDYTDHLTISINETNQFKNLSFLKKQNPGESRGYSVYATCSRLNFDLSNCDLA